MIYIGLDDTDIEGSPGTNKLALELAAQLGDRYEIVQIVRHQLLFDARVPYTSQNGCASMAVRRFQDSGVRSQPNELAKLAEEISTRIRCWCPAGSDPGLCIAAKVPSSIVAFSQRCQRSLVTQQEARDAGEAAGVFLRGLGGTEDGVIGALAAVGLCGAGNDGRVIYSGAAAKDISEVSGPQPFASLTQYGIDAVIEHETGRAVKCGTIDVGKKLRPNIRDRRTVLFVAADPEGASGEPCWRALKVL